MSRWSGGGVRTSLSGRVLCFSRPTPHTSSWSDRMKLTYLLTCCVWVTDGDKTMVSVQQSAKIHRDELWLRARLYICSLLGLLTHRSTVFVLFSLGGRSGPQPPSTHPEDFLFAQLRRGNLAQMWLQTEEKLQGLEVGSGPSFAWPWDLLLPGICLFSLLSSSLLFFLWWSLVKLPSHGSFCFYSSTAQLFLAHL